MLVLISDPLAKSCSIHPRRPTSSDSLEERFVKARSSMALRTYLMAFFIRANPHKMEESLYVLLFRMKDVAFSSKRMEGQRRFSRSIKQIKKFFPRICAQFCPLLFLPQICPTPFFVVFAVTAVVSQKKGFYTTDEKRRKNSLDRVGAEQKYGCWE